MRMAVVGLVALLAVGPGTELGLPVGSLAEVARAATEAGQVGACGGVPIFGARLTVAGRDYEFYSDEQRFILADRADGNETPVWAGVVEVDGRLRVVEQMEYGHWLQRYPVGCSYFMQGA